MNSDIKNKIKILASELKDEIISWRRHIHQNPELSNEEYKTAKFVADKLKKFGVDVVIENFGETPAVVGLIKGKHNITVALRADMDALPMEEKGDKPYKSKVKGVMHSCGHDAHTAMLLGAAKILCGLKEKLQGNVKLIFQPCEERQDCRGARTLVEKGVLENPKVSAIFGIHVFPELPSGVVGTREGHFLASSDGFKIEVIGKGTHASRPHLGVDPVLVSAQVINALHHIVSRKVDPLHPAVLTIGKINGGFAENIIPESVTMEGTVRTLSLNLREKISEWMEETIKGVTSAYGAEYKFSFRAGNPPVINDKLTTRFAISMLRDLLGEDQVVELENPTMGGEDFSEYLLKVPGTFLRLGVRNEKKGITAPLHSPFFDVDEEVLPIGSQSMAYLAYKWLEEHS
ncbi:M20 metallopeptidase family protein [Persephonella sp.]